MPCAQQHKKCCELLRKAYDVGVRGESHALNHYNEMQEWLDLPALLEPCTPKALADRFHFHLLHANQSLKEHRLLPRVTREDQPKGSPPLPIAIYLDRIRSAHNIGSIVRTTEALRLGTLYFSDHMAYIDHKQVQDAAMQCTEWTACEQGRPLESLPRPIICLETSPDAIDLHQFLFPTTFTLVIGNEEFGCSDQALALADHVVRIPLHGRKNSLNVANAFAIAAAEIRRQYHLNA